MYCIMVAKRTRTVNVCEFICEYIQWSHSNSNYHILSIILYDDTIYIASVYRLSLMRKRSAVIVELKSVSIT